MERQRPSEGQWSTGSGSGGRRSQKGKEGPTFVWIATADLPPTATPTAFVCMLMLMLTLIDLTLKRTYFLPST